MTEYDSPPTKQRRSTAQHVVARCGTAGHAARDDPETSGSAATNATQKTTVRPSFFLLVGSFVCLLVCLFVCLCPLEC